MTEDVSRSPTIGSVEHLAVDDGDIVACVSLSGEGLDLFPEAVALDGELAASEEAVEDLVAAIFDAHDLAECVYCSQVIAVEDAHKHHYHDHTDRQYTPAWYRTDSPLDQSG